MRVRRSDPREQPEELVGHRDVSRESLATFGRFLLDLLEALAQVTRVADEGATRVEQ